MPFPVPEVAISTRGDGRSPEALANQAAEARRAEQIREALKVARPPMMVSALNEPSDAELARERNARLMRQGNDAVAFRSQIEAIGAEHESLSAELSTLRRRADEALRMGHVHDVKSFRSKIEDTAIQIDRLALLDEAARADLARAERAEAAELAALEASVPAAEKTLAAFVKARAEYTRLAAQIAGIVEMEAAAQDAHETLRQAARRLPDRSPPAPFPVGVDGRALRISVSIPGFVTVPAARPSVNDAYQR